MGSASITCPVQVGREDSTAALGASAEGAAAGAGRLVFIAGEAGVGKSRLASEAVQLADRHGFVRLEGNCTPDASAPYGPFAAALRRHTRTMSDEQVESFFSGRAALAAGLLPELGLGSAASTEDLFASLWHVFARLAGDQGALVLLEDVHWADPDSLRLLHYLAAEIGDLRLWIVATYRTDELHRRHPLADLLAELSRERRLEEIRLDPLRPEEVRAMLSAIFDGTTISDEFLDAVMDRTDGNPFFVEELARTLVDRGDVYRSEGDWSRRSIEAIELPVSVRDALLARFRGLTPDVADVLTLAAVAGDTIDAEVLAAAVGDPDLVGRALNEALDRQLLVAHQRGESFRFRHALTREAINDELVGPARRRAHARVADALLSVRAADLVAVEAELADHLVAAGEEQRAATFHLSTARHAAAAGATDEAGRRFDLALPWAPTINADRVALLLEAASATYNEEEPERADAFAEEARRLAHEQGDAAAEAEALWTLANGRHIRGDGPAATALLERSLELVQGRDDHREAWTLRMLTRYYALADRSDDAAALLDRGFEVAKRSGHLSALSGLYGTQVIVAEQDDAAEEAFVRAVAAAREGGDLGAEMNVAGNRGFMSAWTGWFARARSSLERAVEIGRPLRPATVAYMEGGLAWVCALLGDYPTARLLAEPLRLHRSAPTRMIGLTALIEVASRCDRDEEAWALVAELRPMAEASGEAQRLVPLLAAEGVLAARRDGADALGVFRTALRTTINERGRGSHWMFSPEAAWALAGDGAVADLEAWVADIDRLTATDDHHANVAAALLCRAALDAATGRPEIAAATLREAAVLFQPMPYPARLVETNLELALASQAAGEHEEAVAAARAAYETARALGATNLADRAVDVIDRVEGSSVLATVLFTDIVGSTEQASALGDLAWRDLLERHQKIVRRELERHGGREIDTAGDGFLAAFDSPARALRCALATTGALHAAGIEIRAGLHTGECRVSGDKLTGLAVHIASRVAAEAAPGEVLVSGTVRDLLAGSEASFEDRGTRRLKGVAEEWRLFAARRSPTPSSGR
jgi:class 3 adenylate cyclase